MMAIMLAIGRRDGLFLAAVEFLLVCSAFVSLLIMLKAWVAGTVLLETSIAAAQNPYWTGWHGNGPAWKWSGPNTVGGFWFEQTEDAVATLQSTFFNGTYYPGTLQWINALVSISTHITLDCQGHPEALVDSRVNRVVLNTSPLGCLQMLTFFASR